MDREADIPANAVFVKFEEVKQTVGGRKVLKVFLIEKAGSKHLAAIAEDLGDAHYIYRSTKLFSKYGTFESHNRKELIQWLERVMRESSGNGEGAHLGPDQQNPEGVYFIDTRQERAHYPDGRRCVRWYLLDQHGESHLAVIGIERDTKDGHYSYTAEEPFASIAPLHCSNQGGVYKWLEKMITHHTGLGNGFAPSAVSGGSALSGLSGDHDGGASGGRKPPLVISLSAILSAKKSHAALKSLEQAVIVDGAYRAKPKPKADTGKAATAAAVAAASTQKHKAVGIVQQIQIKKARKLQDDILAEEQKLVQTHLARLRRVAKAEVERDSGAKATTLGWLHGRVKGDVAEHIDHWLELLQAVLDIQQEQQQQQQEDVEAPAAKQQHAAAAAADGAAAGAESDVMVWVRQPENHRHHLRVVIECLKELAGTDLPARELINRKVVALVQRCLSWPHKAVASMAQHMIHRWQWQLTGHMHVLTCPTYMEDHLGLLEDEIAYGMVPLPQLPKHKQALLNTPIPKLVPESHKTPAPAKQSSLSSSYQQQPPATAPAALNPAAAAGACAVVDSGGNQQLGQFGLQGFNSAQAAAGAFSGSGAFVAPMGALTPAAGTASPGFYLPQGFAGATPGGLVPGSGSALPGLQVLQGVQGMQGFGSSGMAGAASSSSMKGTGSRGLPGLATTTAAIQGSAGKVMYATPAAAAAAAGRPPAVPAVATTAAGMYAGQQGILYINDPAAAGAYGGAWQGSGMFGGAAAAGSGGTMTGAQTSDSTARAAGSGVGVGIASGSSTDLAALGGDSNGAASAVQQQQLAMYAMQQQQQQQQQLRLAGVQQVQYTHALQQQQQHAANTAAAAVAMDPQQQQQWQQWQQQQQALYWQQQQHVQAIWGQGGALVQQQQQQGSAGQATQQANSQGYAHQTQQ